LGYNFHEIFRKQQEEEQVRRGLFGLIKPIISTPFKDFTFVAVGSELHWSKKWKTFHDFLLSYIRTVFGEKWGNNELKKSLKDRHQIMKWYNELCLFQKSANLPDENGIYSEIPTGPVFSYLSLAYDLYLIKHHAKFQRRIIKRLKQTSEFQSARYELFVASTMVRAGCEINYENEHDNRTKHTEFIAKQGINNQIYCVEAKSRRRDGVLGHKGVESDFKSDLNAYSRFISNAIEKNPKHPLLIFIDLNMPSEETRTIFELMPPYNPLTEIIDHIKKNDKGEDEFYLLVFTNTPHYYRNAEITSLPKGHFIVQSTNPKQMPLDSSMFLGLSESLDQYGNIPHEFPKNK